MRDPEIKLILENQSAIMEALIIIKEVLGVDRGGSTELIQMIADTDRRLKNWTNPQPPPDRDHKL